MTPQSLKEWTLEAVRGFIERGDYETDQLELKEKLPHSRDEVGKERLRTACAAFANASGGFIIFGVADDRKLPLEERLKGIDRSIDFMEHFGNFPRGCEPSVDWSPRIPSLELPGGTLLPIIEIPRSNRAPHAVGSAREGFKFPRRTHQGCDFLGYLEVQEMFLNYEQRRIRISMLRAELEQIRLETSARLFPKTDDGILVLGPLIETGQLDLLTADLFALIMTNPELARTLQKMRFEIRTINRLARIQVGGRPDPAGDIPALTQQVHNNADEALVLLDSISEGQRAP